MSWREKILVLSFLWVGGVLSAQNARQMTRKGNKLYEDGKYTEAEVQYKKALQTDAEQFEGKFNMAASMIKQKKYEPAIDQLQILAGTTKDKAQLGKVYHNMGNAYVGAQQLEKGVEAYKLALRNNPNDDETRYNLAFVQKQLHQKQQQQKQQQKNKDQKPPPLTEFAKKLKAQADALVAQGKFCEASQMMEDGLKKDPSVANYQDYMERLKKVCGIDE